MNDDELREMDERCVLAIYTGTDKNGKSYIRWDYPDNSKIYFLIGIMENVKSELLELQEDMSFRYNKTGNYEGEEDGNN
jgi:hypothetical protein